MTTKIKEQTGAFIKRQAKKIASQQNIPHHEALNVSAVAAGFKNWNHFINLSNVVHKQNLSTKVPVTSNSTTISSKERIGKRINPHRNLLVASINKLLDDSKITLAYMDEGIAGSSEQSGNLQCDLFGFPSVLLWEHIGWGEVRISVWWKYNHALHPQANLTGNFRENFRCAEPLAKRHSYKNFVGVVASCWLERKTGRYIMGKDSDKIFDVYTRSLERKEIESLPIQMPKGYAIEGKFII